ncbi:MAG: endonuclease/exonuclease/phosphatase family protein [Planctomycetes bacterium]|nr:endonuclease/exonuclease/phosphatase family protein [Planctomycetota bacterium]
MSKIFVTLSLAVCFACTVIARAEVRVRVGTLNIQTFNGDPTQQAAAVAVLQRVGADVVCVQEIDNSPANAFDDLATAAGYPFRILASGSNTFDGNKHTGIMSVFPFATAPQTLDAIDLSGDPTAMDLTRNFALAELVVPGAAENLVIIGNHWKSGTANVDEFRRSVEAFRTMQATLPYDSTTIPYILAGDLNDDINDSPDSPSEFFVIPSGAPIAYNLGNDIFFPISNGVFLPIQASTGSQRLNVIQAFQKDGSDATRPASGRRIDYLFRSNAMTLVGTEVYDSNDEGLPGGLVKFGAPLAAGTSATASDHLLVFADFDIADNQSGACCTACGCDDTVNAAECLGLGGDFRGAGVACGMEVPACDTLPNNLIINEVVISHDGTQDQEFVEIFGDPFDLLCGVSILVIEGETLSKGNVDLIVSLEDCGGGTPCSLDAEGYFVAGGSGVGADLVIGSGIGRFENGTQTIALVRDILVAANDDIDTEAGGGDGVEDVNVGNVLDAVGIVDSGFPATDAVYFGAVALGPDGSTVPAGGARCPNGLDTDTLDDWVILSKAIDGSDGCVPFTPGVINPAACGGDFNGDGDYDLDDFAAMQQCMGVSSLACSALELDGLCGITIEDFDIFVNRLAGP